VLTSASGMLFSVLLARNSFFLSPVGHVCRLRSRFGCRGPPCSLSSVPRFLNSFRPRPFTVNSRSVVHTLFWNSPGAQTLIPEVASNGIVRVPQCGCARPYNPSGFLPPFRKLSFKCMFPLVSVFNLYISILCVVERI